MDRPRGTLIIDLYGQVTSEDHLRTRFPAVYQHLLETVRPIRLEMRDKARRERWWLFGRSNSDIRAALKGLRRYIATCRLARYRVFVFLDGDILPDTQLVAIGSDSAA